MPSELSRDFAVAFEQLTDQLPFPWQMELYRRFIDKKRNERIPSSCQIPMGLGKTSMIAVWLIALRHGASIPRRLVYAVNRKTVIDQSTQQLECLRRNLGKLESSPDLMISTLRGKFADDREWLADPTRPAVICGTVDMIGSQLLFSGYQIDFKNRPHFAGFLGQDSLLVHNDAHLEPAFQNLLETVQSEQEKECELYGDLPWPGLQVMALSAIRPSRKPNVASKEGKSLELTREEKSPPNIIPHPPTEPIHQIWKRLKAKKTLSLFVCNDEKKELVANVVRRALLHKDSGKAILIFLQTVEDALATMARLEKAFPGHVASITGTMRGFECDRLVYDDPIFVRFVPKSDRSESIIAVNGTVYLVCTSAGEFGVNISADHMVCDLSTFDSMLQRLGRVNRFGEFDDTRVDVVHPSPIAFDEKHPMTPSRKATLDLLKSLNGDASSKSLGEIPAENYKAALRPVPTMLRATDVIFDAWALTTIKERMPGRPPVEPYLHGVSEWEPKQTNVAWRAEVELLTDDLIERESKNFLEELIADYPLKSHELLTDCSDRIQSALQLMIADPSKSLKGEKRKAALDRARKNAQARVWLIDQNGSVAVTTLGNLLDKERKRVIDSLADSTVVLAPSIGGLTGGMLDPKLANADDVADCWFDQYDQPRRQRVFSDGVGLADGPEGMSLVRTINLNPLANEMSVIKNEVDLRLEADKTPYVSHARFWHWYTSPRDVEDATLASAKPIRWDDHTRDVVDRTIGIVKALKLSDELQEAITLSAELHDLGKQRVTWQRSIGNPTPSQWYAKPGQSSEGLRLRTRYLNDFRHEFGSLLDANGEHSTKIAALSEEMRDVVLHLVAAHHGYARPHFPPEAFDHERYDMQRNLHTGSDVIHRYARLQLRYGRWGLAYLESLLRAADWAASVEPSPESLTAKVKA